MAESATNWRADGKNWFEYGHQSRKGGADIASGWNGSWAWTLDSEPKHKFQSSLQKIEVV